MASALRRSSTGVWRVSDLTWLPTKLIGELPLWFRGRVALEIGRRKLLFAAATAVTTASQSVHGRGQYASVSQQELDEAIALHELWLTDMKAGRRCVFAGRRLSGLKFGLDGGRPVDLNGADFAQADLSGTEADDILFHHCNFNGAKFDRCRWLRPVFAFADMRRTSAKSVEWGISGRREVKWDISGQPRSETRSLADFSHAALRDADLSDAKICGYFYGTKMNGASLKRADISFSDFLGPKHYEMSFSRATLSGASLRNCQISAATFLNADCTEADFSHTVFSDVQMKGCNLNGARFDGAEIECTPFSTEQIDQANIRRGVG
jgi:uncharacterized protein YjbI with pentapeptide repeats